MFKITDISGNRIMATIMADDPIEFHDIVEQYIDMNSVISLSYDHNPPDTCIGRAMFYNWGLLHNPDDPEYIEYLLNN